MQPFMNMPVLGVFLVLKPCSKASMIGGITSMHRSWWVRLFKYYCWQWIKSIVGLMSQRGCALILSTCSFQTNICNNLLLHFLLVFLAQLCLPLTSCDNSCTVVFFCHLYKLKIVHQADLGNQIKHDLKTNASLFKF